MLDIPVANLLFIFPDMSLDKQTLSIVSIPKFRGIGYKTWSEKMVTVSDGFLVHNVTGIRVHIVSRLDGKGYDITKRMFALTCILHDLLTFT